MPVIRGTKRKELVIKYPPIPDASCLRCGGPVESFWENHHFLCRKCKICWSRRSMLIHTRESRSAVKLFETELQLNPNKSSLQIPIGGDKLW